MEGRYSVGTGVQKNSLQQIDWSKPQFFRKGGDVVSVGFSHKGEDGGFFELEIKVAGEELTVQQVLPRQPCVPADWVAAVEPEGVDQLLHSGNRSSSCTFPGNPQPSPDYS